jgi:two-component system, NtrC family, response regulator HydG
MAWPISGAPLVLGRDPSCAISLNDPTVSRHHCQILMEGDRPRVTDLGSRNATFLNGSPVRDAVLAPGDELAVGATVFGVIRALDTGPLARTRTIAAVAATSALQMGKPVYSNESGDSLLRKGRPSSSEDLVELFNLGRVMSQADTVAGLGETLLAAVRRRLSPLWCCMVLRGDGDGGLSVLPAEAAADFDRDKPLVELAVSSMGKQKGVLLPEHLQKGAGQRIRSTLVAPVVLGREPVGAIIARGETPASLYDEGDLEHLIALGHAAAPYLRAIERLERLEVENRRLVAGIAHAAPIIGDSPAVREVRELARSCARSRLNILILGETGTGKELMARMIHELSDLAAKPLVVVNCAAIPDDLFESEVFGHERGAFTGAHAARRGLMEEADGGTLFLDEVGDLSAPNQARLLRAIETGLFRRLGGSANIQVSVRVLAATNRDLRRAVAENAFRRDLYHRLNAFEIRIPPLRERIDDVPELAARFLQNAARDSGGRPPRRLSEEALEALRRHPWPGNVRELRNVIERAAVVARGAEITPEDLWLGDAAPEEETPFPTLDELEKGHIREALHRCGGNTKEAAELLNIARSTLYRKITEYNLES